MTAKLAHIAIAADDVDRARRFYEQVFGWEFEPWGPPNFYHIKGAGIHGALQERRGAATPGAGIECTFAVANLETASAAIAAAGGTLMDQVYEIPGVGRLQRFSDCEHNELLIMQYEPAHARELGLPAVPIS
ncbi:MAG: VOC family protein [Pseudomonadota bacterium]